VLRAARHRAGSLAGLMARRWHRSLQLRVIGTTLVVSVVVVAVLGIFLMQQIASGLLNSEQKAATIQASEGYTFAQSDPDVLSPNGSTPSALISLVTQLQSGSELGNNYDVVVLQRGTGSGLAGVTGNQANNQGLAKSIPEELRGKVAEEQISGVSGAPYTMPTTLLGAHGQPLGPALAVGVPISSDDQLYYLFPLAQQMQVLSLVQNTLTVAGVGLVLLLALIVSLVTRWVVVPIRQAAQAASRVSAGNLDERMAARGTDDLAGLANSFNEMAASLQDKLQELEELSSVQRQFVSDVSHELRTPLTTIRIAADVLFGASEELDPAARRSAELLQARRECGDPGCRVRGRVRPRAACGGGRGAACRPAGDPHRVPAAGRPVHRRGGPPPGGAGAAQPAGQRGRARRGTRRGGDRRRRPGRGGGRGP